MGKMVTMISTIIFVDILFILFWGTSTSLTSILFNWIVDPTNFDGNLVTLAFFSLFSTIAAGALTAVVVALSGAKTDTVLFASFASGVLYNVGKDYLFMFQELTNINVQIANVFMIPFIVMFSWISIEWLRGKDGS